MKTFYTEHDIRRNDMNEIKENCPELYDEIIAFIKFEFFHNEKTDDLDFDELWERVEEADYGSGDFLEKLVDYIVEDTKFEFDDSERARYGADDRVRLVVGKTKSGYIAFDSNPALVCFTYIGDLGNEGDAWARDYVDTYKNWMRDWEEDIDWSEYISVDEYGEED